MPMVINPRKRRFAHSCDVFGEVHHRRVGFHAALALPPLVFTWTMTPSGSAQFIRHRLRHLSIEAVGELDRVHGLDDGEGRDAANQRANLVALEVADEAPVDVRGMAGDFSKISCT